jgi:hypothetical protein
VHDSLEDKSAEGRSEEGEELRRDSHLDDADCRLENGIAVSAEAFDVKLNALADELLGFFDRGSGDSETGQIGGVALRRVADLSKTTA